MARKRGEGRFSPFHIVGRISKIFREEWATDGKTRSPMPSFTAVSAEARAVFSCDVRATALPHQCQMMPAHIKTRVDFARQKETAPPAKAGSAVEASYPSWQHEDWRTEMAALLSEPEFLPFSAAFLRHQLFSRCRLAGRCHRHFPALHPAPPHAF